MAAYELVFIESGRQDSNLRPSAPKSLDTSIAALGFQAITIFFLIFAQFLLTNKPSYDIISLIDSGFNIEG